MKFTILIISLCVASTYCSVSFDCYLEHKEMCDESLNPKKLPETIEELKRDCKNIYTFGTCRTHIEEICEGDSEMLAVMRNALSYINSTCHEDNRIFDVVSRNFDCVKNMIVKLEYTCPRPDISKESYMAIEAKTEELGLSEDPKLLRCLEEFLTTTCKSTLLGEECGEESERAIVEILANIDFGFGMCVKEYPKEWEALYDFFQSVVREERLLEKNLEEKRR